MLELADIVRLHGATYRARAGERLLPSHARALRDIEACRTAQLGGHLKQCDQCGRQLYSYHSCGNRACPKCHGEQTERWLAQARALLLPCRYVLLTFTLPAELRALARSHQKILYGALMRCAAAALHKLARDPRYLGARIGALAVLHTWTRALDYHPHVHLLVSAGGWSAAAHQWIAPRHPAYLVPVRALSVIFRAKMCAALARAGLLAQTPHALWNTDWVVHCQSAGSGERCSSTWPLRVPDRDQQQPSGAHRQRRGDLPLPRRAHPTPAPRAPAGTAVPGALPATRAAARPGQGALLRTVQPARRRATPSSARAARQRGCALGERDARHADRIARPAGSASPAQCCAHCHSGRLLIIEVLRPPPRAPP